MTAREARDGAADAFYRMDLAQQETHRQVDTYTRLFAGSPTADQMRSAFEVVNAHCDDVARLYIEALDRYDVEKELPKRVAQAAQAQLGQVSAALADSTRQIDEFRAQHAGDFARVGPALAQVGPKVAAARLALDRARSAIADLESQRLRPGLAGEALAGAVAGAQVLAQGAEVLGVAGTLRQAEHVAALADRAISLAQDLPRKRDEVMRRLSSLRTRNEAVTNRVPAVEAGLSQLRRGYSEKCWQDVADAPAAMRERAAQAGQLREQAAVAAQAGDYDHAMEALREATQALATAESRERALAERRTALLDAADDPAGRIAKVRFALRDAQRLVMSGAEGSSPPAKWAARLDPLVGRLERSDAGLGGPHPDYWAFLTELTAITDAIAAVVTEVRSERARHRG